MKRVLSLCPGRVPPGLGLCLTLLYVFRACTVPVLQQESNKGRSGRVDRQMHEWTVLGGCMEGWMGNLVDGWIDTWMSNRACGSMGRWMGGWVEEWARPLNGKECVY